MSTFSPILDHNGRPFDIEKTSRNKVGASEKTYGGGSFINTYLGALESIRVDASVRSRRPYENHAWVFAAASAIAMTASQSPITIFRETREELEKRRLMAKERNEIFNRNYGRKRRVLQRHRLTYGLEVRDQAIRKSLEPFESHRLQQLFDDPNEFQDGQHFTQITLLHLALNGEAFWVYTNEAGELISYNDTPDRMYVIAPGCMEPMFSGGPNRGSLIGWWLQPPYYMEKSTEGYMKYFLELDMVTQFKMPNPYDPVRGMSPITAAALSIQSDMLARSANHNLLENGGVPRGVVSYEGHMDKDTRRELEDKWKEKFEETSRRGSRTAFLPNGMKYSAVGLSNQDIQFLEGLKWGREEILAVLNVPPSVLGSTEFTNYATQLGQDKNFYDKGILPRTNIIERGVDNTLLYSDPDDVTAIFDTTGVEALRSGQMDKVSIAERLVAEGLHVPPNVAYEAVGLEISNYPVDDVCFISLGKTTPEKTIEELDKEPEPVPPALQPFMGDEQEQEVPEEETEGDDDLEESDQPAMDESEAEERFTSRTGVFFVPKSPSRNKLSQAFIKLESAFEADFIKRYRSWIKGERANTLKLLNDLVKNLEISLPQIFDTAKAKNSLRSAVRSSYPAITEGAYELTSQELGVATFEIDDTSIIEEWSKREAIFTESHSQTLAKNLGLQLQEGIQSGETIGQIRLRIASVFDISASSAKADTIARTEVSSLMNGVRDKMFDLNGITVEDWVDAEDERVRTSHRIFGEAGPKNRGFNYLTLVGDSGILEYPGDSRAPAHQVIRCRCIKIAVK